MPRFHCGHIYLALVLSGQAGLCDRGPAPMCLPSPDQVTLLGMVVLKPAPATVTLVQLHTPLPPVTLLKKSDPSGFSAATCEEPDVRVGVGQVLLCVVIRRGLSS